MGAAIRSESRLKRLLSAYSASISRPPFLALLQSRIRSRRNKAISALWATRLEHRSYIPPIALEYAAYIQPRSSSCSSLHCFSVPVYSQKLWLCLRPVSNEHLSLLQSSTMDMPTTNPSLHRLIVYGPDANCTLKAGPYYCDPKYGVYQYRPSIAANATFIALYLLPCLSTPW